MISVNQLIQVEVVLRDSLVSLEQEIRQELSKYGLPLRWVVLDVDPERDMVQVEAMIAVTEQAS